MSSSFRPCRVCGEPVFVGAKRCPNCQAAMSWRLRLRKNVFSLLILALVGLGVLGVLLFGWPDETVPIASKGPGAGNPPPVAAPPATASARPRPTPSKPAKTIQETARNKHPIAALQQHDRERAGSISVRGKRIEPGMSADSLFEVVHPQDLIGQTMEPDQANPPNLRFVKYYKVDGHEFAVELLKATPNSPYRVTWIRILRHGESPKRKG